MFMRKIRNFLCFFIYSFHLNSPTTEEQITDRQVRLCRVTNFPSWVRTATRAAPCKWPFC